MWLCAALQPCLLLLLLCHFHQCWGLHLLLLQS